MGRLRNIVAGLLLPLAFAGCTVQVVTPSAEPSVQTSTVTTQETEAKFDAAFVKQYKEYVGTMPSNETVLAAREVGHATCKALDSGATAKQVVQVLIQGQTGTALQVVLIAAGTGVGIYCPQYIKEFNE